MATAKHRSRHHNNYDLYADLEKIKNAFADTAYDMRGKTGEMFSESLEGVKDRSLQMRDGIVDYTSEKPFKSLGIALLAGVAIGWLLRK